jgi:hypothetical protein
MRHFIATGVVAWDSGERVSDRYGTIFLRTAPGGDIVSLPDTFDGQSGMLIACIREARRSPHIGDLFRGLHPPEEPLAVGTEVRLGTGEVFREDVFREEDLEDGEGAAIGLLPADGREHDWLDPEALYQVHYQTIDLFFEPQ